MQKLSRIWFPSPLLAHWSKPIEDDISKRHFFEQNCTAVLGAIVANQISAWTKAKKHILLLNAAEYRRYSCVQYVMQEEARSTFDGDDLLGLALPYFQNGKDGLSILD